MTEAELKDVLPSSRLSQIEDQQAFHSNGRKRTHHEPDSDSIITMSSVNSTNEPAAARGPRASALDDTTNDESDGRCFTNIINSVVRLASRLASCTRNNNNNNDRNNNNADNQRPAVTIKLKRRGAVRRKDGCRSRSSSVASRPRHDDSDDGPYGSRPTSATGSKPAPSAAAGGSTGAKNSSGSSSGQAAQDSEGKPQEEKEEVEEEEEEEGEKKKEGEAENPAPADQLRSLYLRFVNLFVQFANPAVEALYGQTGENRLVYVK